ncbi:MAG TPA: histidine phosphatase family protein [Candidatus Acidoferrales bacterium]|nr:histidine phosphatase family protein [Candidatus Acidoferrales bacterium]
MSRLFLVRHAQACFLGPNYDELSPQGETQARLLGQYWARRNQTFERAASGPRTRQTSTARIVGEAFRAEGKAFPEPLLVPEFDEYAGEAVMERILPGLLRRDEGVRRLHEDYQRSMNPDERRRIYQRLFEMAIATWVEEEPALDGVEPWSEFCARVNRGLSLVLGGGNRGEQIAVFASGGPIGVAMQRALNLSARHTLGVTWMSANCSYSEFLFSGGRFTLSAFNAHPHLDDPSQLTYR